MRRETFYIGDPLMLTIDVQRSLCLSSFCVALSKASNTEATHLVEMHQIGRGDHNTQKSMSGNETVKCSNNVKCVKGQNIEGVME